jgi:hypothetical protein
MDASYTTYPWGWHNKYVGRWIIEIPLSLEQYGVFGHGCLLDIVAGALEATGDLFRRSFEVDALVGIDRSQVIKVGPLKYLVGVQTVDRHHTQQRGIAFVVLGEPNLSPYQIPVAEQKTPDL